MDVGILDSPLDDLVLAAHEASIELDIHAQGGVSGEPNDGGANNGLEHLHVPCVHVAERSHLL